jgi:hypothetical protein
VAAAFDAIETRVGLQKAHGTECRYYPEPWMSPSDVASTSRWYRYGVLSALSVLRNGNWNWKLLHSAGVPPKEQNQQRVSASLSVVATTFSAAYSPAHSSARLDFDFLGHCSTKAIEVSLHSQSCYRQRLPDSSSFSFLFFFFFFPF